jgi:hypothetical protein
LGDRGLRENECRSDEVFDDFDIVLVLNGVVPGRDTHGPARSVRLESESLAIWPSELDPVLGARRYFAFAALAVSGPGEAEQPHCTNRRQSLPGRIVGKPEAIDIIVKPPLI